MFANDEAPQFRARAFSGQLQPGHPELIGHGALRSHAQHAADLADVDSRNERRRFSPLPAR
eukprot:11318672-Alexandrium_andersonii.AAC.1